MDIQTIAILGSGQMGAGIAQVAAQAGCTVYLYDVSPKALEKAQAGINKSLQRLADKGKISQEDHEAALARIKTTGELAQIADSDLVIEAIVENLSVKRSLWQEVDHVCSSDAIFASNTSSLAITELANFVSRPERFIGMHFFNPVPMMSLVEVIDGLQTADTTHEAVMVLAKKLGKTPVALKDSPGFVVNRLLIPMINEAFFILHEGAAAPDAIDTAMKLGANHPMGPLALADFIGLDTILAIMEVLYRDLGEPKYRPCPLLRKYVQAGKLGKKSGAGVYDYAPVAK
ncbi:MAG: 3-hydroxybutyryl-CoA dehydrogenase [Bacteroidota bacterium]